MASIRQIVDFMNLRSSTWQPQLVVDVKHTEQKTAGNEHLEHVYIPTETDKLYFRQGGQKFIGHYYFCKNNGNNIEGTILLPLNSGGKYLKAVLKSDL